MVPSLFQDATCRDISYCVSLKQALAVIPFFKVDSQFHCSQLYGDRPLFIIKSNCDHAFFQISCAFAGIVARRYHNSFDTSLISGMHILKEVCCMMTSFPSIHPFFLWQSHYFIGALEMIYYVNETVFISQRLLQPSIVTSGLWFIWGKPL